MNEENNNENEPVMDSSIENIRHFIRQAEELLGVAKNMAEEMALAEAAKAVNQKEWLPPSKGWCVGSTYVSQPYYEEANHSDARNNALLWETREAGLAQLDRDIFFRRLCALAADLQGGKVGGNYEVFFSRGEWLSIRAFGFVGGIFNSPETATNAAEIMNRDGWKMPEGLGGVK